MRQDHSERNPQSADLESSNLDRQALYAILANNINALLILDPDGIVLFANEAAQRLFGRQSAQLTGSPFGFPLQPGLTVDAEIVRPDNSVVIVDLRVEPIEWQGTPAMLAVLHDITDRKQAEQQLIEMQQLLHSALDALPTAIAILNRYGQVLAANVRWLQLGPLLGVETVDCAVGASFLAACHLGGKTAGVIAQAIERLLHGDVTRYDDEFAVGKEARRWLEIRVVRFGSGERVRAVVVLDDISARRKAEQIALARRRVLELIARQYDLRTVTRELLHLIGEQIPDLIYAACVVRSSNLFVSYSTSLPEEAIKPLDAWAGEVLASELRPQQRMLSLRVDPSRWPAVDYILQAYAVRETWMMALRTNRDADSWLLICRQQNNPLTAEEQLLIEQFEQLSLIALEQHAILHKLAYQAHHDALTGLPNRLLFEDRLQQAIEHARRANTMVAVLFIDLDRFKHVNDTLGHTTGDRLLIQVARRFEACIRAADTIARHGGDEFLLVLSDITSPQQVTHVVRRLHEALDQPFFVNGHEIFVSASIGASLYPIDGTDVIALQRAADVAMYRAKQLLHNSFQFFDAAITDVSIERLQIENLLRRAIERHELLLYYQPKVDRTGQLVGLEALLRWQHPEWGMVSPARFIPIAEETGLIVPIGRWVLREVARQVTQWWQDGLKVVPVAVNVSVIQFTQADFAQTVADTVAQTALPFSWLELELTESMLMGQIDDLRRQLGKLRQLGVTLAIDDFGTGYSSLSYLHRLPINVLKIDRSFVARLDQDDAGVERSLITTIITLGHHLGVQIVAEGVETAGQRQILFDAGCDVFQGYYISRPLPAGVVRGWLEQNAGTG
ncbi:sensor domain-containing protein [Chloroflexus sp.]|uniref:sensor domain-containing protein n=1 Tax=Chloroflexus sp. TaxID=1904827 RepID=UPI004049E8BB